MDAVDYRIVDTLQEQGRISNQQLAEAVGISTAACWRRVRALEDSGVIERYAAIVSRHKVGLELSAMVHVTLARHMLESTTNFADSVRHRPEVMECFATTGDADYILRVVTKDIISLDRFLEEFLFSLPQIAQVRSNIVLRELKYDTALPLQVGESVDQ